MSYRDPGQIQADQSGQIYGQAMANLGQSFLSFAQGIAAQRKKEAEEQKAENDKIQEIGYKIEEAYYNSANENYKLLADKSPALQDQFKTVVTQLLDGTGTEGEEGYQMGAIEAQTKLATQSNLSKEDKKKYRAIVQKAKAFQDRMIQGGGDLMADLADLDKVKPQDIGSTHFYIGNTPEERLTSQYTAAVLGNRPIPGAKSTKTLTTDEDGMPIVSVSTTFDADSEEGKALLEKFSGLKDRVVDGKIIFNWERSTDKLGDGFIGEIPTGTDAVKTFKTTGAEDGEGNLTQQMKVGDPLLERRKTDAAGVENLVTMQYVNSAGLKQDPTFIAQINGTVQGLIAQEPGYLQGFMQNTLQLGPNFDYGSFMKLPAAEKTAFLVEEESNRVIKQRLSQYSSRPATEEDVAYFNANAKSLTGKGDAPSIKKDDLIYYIETKKQVGEYKPESSDTKDKPTIISQDRWDGMKESGYTKGNYKYKWNDALGGFEQYLLSSVEGRQSERKVDGVLAKSPQELGNISGGQNWNNFQGFEIQEPEAITQRIIGPVDLESELNI
jgi:hypothetical protein